MLNDSIAILAHMPPPPCRWQSNATSFSGGKIDKENGVVSGVSVITSGVEAIGHGIYTDPTTLLQVKGQADSMPAVQVKAGHGTGFSGIVGVLKNFRVDDDGRSCQLRADLHLLKSHPAFSQIIEMAATMPESFGLSISFSGKPETIDALDFARCTELYSVDLVDRPAANPNGLFSANQSPMNVINFSQWRAMSADNQKSFCMNGGQMTREAFLSLPNRAQEFFLSAGGHIEVAVATASPKTKIPPANSMWRKEFLKLEPEAQSAWFAAGKKLHD